MVSQPHQTRNLSDWPFDPSETPLRCVSPGWLRATQHVRHVILRNNSIALDATKMRVLVHLLRARKQAIDALVFDYHRGVSSDAVQLLIGWLTADMPSLRSLSLAGCRVDDDGAKVVASAVSALRGLQELCMEDNPFSPTARSLLRKACRPRDVVLSAFSEIENEVLVE